MALKFEILNEEVEIVRGTSRKTGNPYELRKQRARVEMGDETRMVNVMLERDQPPYKKGVYRMADSSFSVGGYGDLQVRLALEPLTASAGKAA